MNTTSRLFAAIQDFPEPILAEVVDFAEFLRSKRMAVDLIATNQPLAQLAGGLENSPCFSGDALSLQNRLRDEWN